MVLKRTLVWISLALVLGMVFFLWMVLKNDREKYLGMGSCPKAPAGHKVLTMQLQGLRALGQRLGVTPSMEELKTQLRLFCHSYPEYSHVFVADSAGRILAGHDASQLLGQETMDASSLDPVVARRRVLTSGREFWVEPWQRHRPVSRLALGVPIVRPTGQAELYLGAGLELSEPICFANLTGLAKPRNDSESVGP